MKNLGIIYGGISTEHDVSVMSAKSVIENMPIRQLLSYIPGLSRDMLEKMLDMLNSQR